MNRNAVTLPGHGLQQTGAPARGTMKAPPGVSPTQWANKAWRGTWLKQHPGYYGRGMGTTGQKLPGHGAGPGGIKTAPGKGPAKMVPPVNLPGHGPAGQMPTGTGGKVQPGQRLQSPSLPGHGAGPGMPAGGGGKVHPGQSLLNHPAVGTVMPTQAQGAGGQMMQQPGGQMDWQQQLRQRLQELQVKHFPQAQPSPWPQGGNRFDGGLLSALQVPQRTTY